MLPFGVDKYVEELRGARQELMGLLREILMQLKQINERMTIESQIIALEDFMNQIEDQNVMPEGTG